MTILLILAIAIGVIASTATVHALVTQRAPRVAADPERLARLRDRELDRELDREARRLAVAVEERVAHRLDAPGNGLAPQMSEPVGAAIWAAALPAR
ncbi:hypothetical protein [Agrococcus sp. HG114]|uniref:hypothetical protein n=1 Tax=Agrococcus sp. HG114 TaxID=2969757 RepID=UPI00215B30E2|nr:hypothetical protein [Agrococcus sp. HG114]MCR8670033.1 hypothetical protein [Agrococcus sp. HG114]